MNPPVTTHTGSLGSTLHVLRADAGTIAALAAIDWNRHFSLVGLDPVRGLITLLSASNRHGLWSVMLDDVLNIAGSTLTGASRGLRHSRLRGPGEPPDTGVEPDGSYYLGERVGGYIAALTAGDEAADTYFERTPPDLAYEVELMDADEGKVERYAELGVRELWLLHARKGTRDFRVEFLSLHPGCAPRRLDASEVLEGFTPEDVYEAEAGSRLCMNLADRMEVVNNIARRRGGDSARVRESAAACDRAIESLRALRREVLAGIDGIDESGAGSNADDRSGPGSGRGLHRAVRGSRWLGRSLTRPRKAGG